VEFGGEFEYLNKALAKMVLPHKSGRRPQPLRTAARFIFFVIDLPELI
jgi:hypothetical protein